MEYNLRCVAKRMGWSRNTISNCRLPFPYHFHRDVDDSIWRRAASQYINIVLPLQELQQSTESEFRIDIRGWALNIRGNIDDLNRNRLRLVVPKPVPTILISHVLRYYQNSKYVLNITFIS